jgi:regulator of protease activity HflC (stomatin/prohibitin superfamily)
MWGLPKYNVWQKELAGQAELKQAEWNRQIAIQEANAKKEAANSLAEAEVIRARGVAEANEIIGESLRENEAYLRYLWINGLHDGSSEVIYIPTEANLPILEAVRKAPNFKSE